MDLAHLRPEIRELARLPPTERLARVPANCWIGYGRASQAVALLERLLASEPGRVRPRNVLVVGPTNNGKTAIAEHLRRTHPQQASENREHEVIPVLLVQMPPSPTVGRLYAAVLAGLGMPGAIGSRSPDREAMAMRVLRQVGCRMLLLDELHNLLAASGARQRELLNLLRYLGNELRIPIACFGTREAYLASQLRSGSSVTQSLNPGRRSHVNRLSTRRPTSRQAGGDEQIPFWNPFDHDRYNGQADATLVIDNEEYKVNWIVPITRQSSFNPYSNTGRQDKWRFDWGGQTVVLHDGTTLWIDASKAIAGDQAIRLLGITGTQPVARPPRSPDMLGPRHPLVIKVPVYTLPANGHVALPYYGNCDSTRPACFATVRFSVPSDYIGPYDRNPANYLSEAGPNQAIRAN